MNFSSAQRVIQTIRSGDQVEWIRATNRVKINDHANCVPPFKAEVAKKLGIKVNVNFGELMVLLQHARLQFLSAFWSNLHFFKVNIPDAPPDHQSEWETMITNFINKCMRDSIPYFETHNSKWASVVAHGMGPTIWYHPTKWCPKYRAVGDVRISTDVTIDFENLEWFSDRHIYTPGELLDEAFKPNSQWNKEQVKNILKNLKNRNWGDAINNYNWNTDAEKLRDLVRQNGGYYSSDAMPGIPLWRFYFEDKTDPNNSGWFMRIVPDKGVPGAVGLTKEDFLWPLPETIKDKLEKPVGKHWREIIHCQWGDLNIDAPFKVHSMRSVGFALMEPCFYSNLTIDRMVQHLQDQFNILLRVTDPIDKARATIQEFFNMGVLKSGVSIVPETERHQVDSQLIDMVLSKTKQLQSEASSSYTQQSDNGTQKEETAFAVSVKLQQVNALMSGLLMKAFIYEKPSYVEICRRFCLTNSDDEDVIKFHKRCDMSGIPPVWRDVDLWDIEPVTPLGMGNPTAAMAEAQQLMSARGAYDADAQQEILHDFTLTLTKDPNKAARLVPLGKAKGATPGMKIAESDFNILMRGIPVNQMQGISTAEQLQTLLGLLSGVISKREQAGNMASAQDIDGFNTVGAHCQALIDQMSQDPAQQQVVEQAKNSLMELMNIVKGFEQRLQQQMQAQNDQNGNGELTAETQAKVASSMVKAHVDAELKSKKQAQASVHKDIAFKQEQERKDAGAFAEIQRKNLMAKVDAKNQEEKKDEPKDSSS